MLVATESYFEKLFRNLDGIIDAKPGNAGWQVAKRSGIEARARRRHIGDDRGQGEVICFSKSLTLQRERLVPMQLRPDFRAALTA